MRAQPGQFVQQEGRPPSPNAPRNRTPGCCPPSAHPWASTSWPASVQIERGGAGRGIQSHGALGVHQLAIVAQSQRLERLLREYVGGVGRQSDAVLAILGQCSRGGLQRGVGRRRRQQRRELEQIGSIDDDLAPGVRRHGELGRAVLSQLQRGRSEGATAQRRDRLRRDVGISSFCACSCLTAASGTAPMTSSVPRTWATSCGSWPSSTACTSTVIPVLAVNALAIAWVLVNRSV